MAMTMAKTTVAIRKCTNFITRSLLLKVIFRMLSKITGCFDKTSFRQLLPWRGNEVEWRGPKRENRGFWVFDNAREKLQAKLSRRIYRKVKPPQD